MKIEAAPMDAMYDEPIRVRLSEFPPLHSVTLRASAMDGRNRSWNSNGTFITGPDGALDLSDTTPRAGTYRSSDANGLLWSMQLAADVAERTPFAVTRPDTVRVRLSAEIDGVEAASVELRRRIVADGVVREEIRNDGIVATFFRHASGARPGVIVLGGSGGGLAEDQPALLASHGYAVLSLAYFLMPGLPQELIEIPLEYFQRAIAWMKRNPAVDSDRIAVIGASRGGELALLLGATFAEIKAVVAYVPSGVVWPGIGAPGPARPAWTSGGNPIDFMEAPPPDPSLWSSRPVALRSWFAEAIANRESVARASIAVERIGGPVLMFSGTDDRMWPSLNLADLAVQRMIERDFPHPYEHVSYAGAGHFIRFPYSPVISEILHPLTGISMALGGSPEANHVANLDSWHRCLSFLKRFLG